MFSDPRRAARRRRLARARQRVLGASAAEHAARRAGRRLLGVALTCRRRVGSRPCSPPPAPPCCPACSTAHRRGRQGARRRCRSCCRDKLLPSDIDRLYALRLRLPRGLRDRRSRRAADCGGANACSPPTSAPSKGGKPFGTRKVDAGQGRTGRYKPLSCGGSCSPPSIAWVRARRALHDPGQRGREEHGAPPLVRSPTRRSGTARARRASRSAAASTAPSRPGKRASISSRRSDTWRCVPSARVCVRPASRSTRK